MDKKNNKLIRKTVITVFWLIFIVFCLINREKITIDNILSFTPKNLYLAAFVMFLLFAIKSVSVVIYGGLLMRQAELCFLFLLRYL